MHPGTRSDRYFLQEPNRPEPEGCPRNTPKAFYRRERRAEDRPRPLDTPNDADIMSDMKTFTVRELDRSPGEVLEASRIDGKARIRARGGQAYTIMPESAPARRITSLPNFAARRAALLAKPLSPEFTRQFDRALAGE
jgi:hypothetical protein